MGNDELQDGVEHDGGPGRSARRSFMLLAGAAAAGGAATVVGAGPADAVGPVDGGTASAPIDLIKARRATAAQWASTNPALALGEPGVETDTGRVKFGRVAGSPAVAQAWNLLPYADGQTATTAAAATTVVSDNLQAHLDHQVTLDVINTASSLKGSEKVLAWQLGSPPSDVMVDLDRLRSYGRADAVQVLSTTADLVSGATMVLGNAASACAVRLPTYSGPAFADRPTMGEPWRVRIIQLDTGKIEIAKTLVSGSPNPNVTLASFALTQAAAAAAAATPPQTAPTRIRTKGRYAVVVAEAVAQYGGVTVWVISGDVEAF